ncbi:replication initiator [Streptomyces sp. DB-54]
MTGNNKSFSRPEERRMELDRDARIRALSETERDLLRVVSADGFERWLQQMQRIGGCAHPIYLAGHTIIYDKATGEALRRYDTRDEPGRRLAVRCRNRRETRCGPCSRLHAGDTYHLVRAGLAGGKGTPPTVRGHPRLFVTLTAPSFGPVHHIAKDGGPCRPRRGGGECEHGRSVECRAVHAAGDTRLGQPLCPDCYDYAGHVLWNAHAGQLWNRFCGGVRRLAASANGIPQSRLREHAILSFTKVAEYQLRGAIHFHAVIRLDGSGGPKDSPPEWGDSAFLEEVIRLAAIRITVTSPYSPAVGERVLRWGKEMDVHPITSSSDDGSPMTDDKIAAYVAKYVGKSVGDVHGTDHVIRSAGEIALLPVNEHVRTLMLTCWRLGELPELASLRLHAWAHALGSGGHVLTKSRVYSTTYGELRAARAGHAVEGDGGDLAQGDTAVESNWSYVGSGHTLAESEIAAGIADDIAQLREIARDLAEPGSHFEPRGPI